MALLLTVAVGARAQSTAPDPINLTANTDGTEWTLASSPAYYVELEVTYYTDEEVAAAENVISLINAIGTVEYTDASKALIDAARSAYDALTDAQKALVTNYTTLTAAETTYAAAENVISLINAIGTVEYTDASKALIDAARTAYDALTDAQKALVTNYTTLTAAETEYAELLVAAHNTGVNLTMTGTNEWTLDATPAFDIELEVEYETALALNDVDDNTEKLTEWNGFEADITLQGRTLTKDGNWNTLCLPFSLASFTGTPLEDATVKELLSTSNLDDNGVLTLNFTDANSIEAGKPYIVRWGTPESPVGGTIENPVFSGVTITSTTPTAVNFTGGSFVGQYSPFKIGDVNNGDDGNKNEIILMSSGNRIGYSQNPRTLKCFRCHFYVPANGGQQARSFVVDFGDATGIEPLTISPEGESHDGAWYSLDGRKVDGKPTQGLYIVNGKKVVIK